MNVFGYKKNSENLIKLKEVTIQSNIEELDKIIEFLQEVREEHSKVMDKVESCHSHFRDWDIEWKVGSPDIIIVTTSTK